MFRSYYIRKLDTFYIVLIENRWVIVEIVKRFKSKKNNVYLVKSNGDFKVLKKYSDINNFEKEKSFYEILKLEKIRIPNVIKENIEEKSMLFEYIGYRTAVEMIEKYELESKEDECIKLILKIYEWLKDFHSITYIKENNLCFFDLSLRHFIIYRDEIYGIDFESITEGSISLDVGRMLAMYLYYDKIKSDFKLKVLEKVKKQILAEEHIRPEDLDYSLRREEEMIKIRRDIH
jgi:hypothetical protein